VLLQQADHASDTDLEHAAAAAASNPLISAPVIAVEDGDGRNEVCQPDI
jgi:hypothetical protein